MKTNLTKHNAAQNLYFQTELTQEKIAYLSGISTKTLYLWIKKGNWEHIKKSIRHTPATLVEQFLGQLEDINNKIATRPLGERHATDKEIEIIRKLTSCVRGMRYEVGLSASIDVLTNFTQYLAHVNPDMAYDVSNYMNDYLSTTIVKPLPQASMHAQNEEEYKEQVINQFNDNYDREQLEESPLSPVELEEHVQAQQLSNTYSHSVGNQSETNRKYTGNESETFGNNWQSIGNTTHSFPAT